MSKKKQISMEWEQRFDEVYWDAKLSEEERIRELKYQVLDERHNTIRDILNRIMAIPMENLSEEQEMVVENVRSWFNQQLLPEIMEDYKIRLDE